MTCFHLKSKWRNLSGCCGMGEIVDVGDCKTEQQIFPLRVGITSIFGLEASFRRSLELGALHFVARWPSAERLHSIWIASQRSRGGLSNFARHGGLGRRGFRILGRFEVSRA